MAEPEPLEDVTPRRQRITEPAAEASAPVAAPPPQRSGALFDTGMGVGMGAPTPTSLLRHLARSSEEDRKAGIEDLNERVGNRQVSRMIQRVVVPPQALSEAQKLEKARKSKDIADIKAINDFGPATEAERIEFIGILLKQSWVGPMDEYALERLWNSFGERVGEVADRNIGLWKDGIKKGVDPSHIKALDGLRKHWEADVKAVAGAFMRSNRKKVEAEAQRLGLGDLRQGGAPAQVNQKAMAELQQQAAEVERADQALAQLRDLPVGYDYDVVEGPGRSMRSKKVLATYSPSGPPMVRPSGEEASKFARWEDVDKHYKAVSQARAVLASRNPSLFAASEAKGNTVGKIAKATPEEAAAKLRELLSATLKNIDATEPKLSTGDLDWRDLVPIHKQLYGGLPSASGTKWNSTFAQEVAKDVIGDYEAKEFWITLGLGSLAAAAFIVSEIATAGMATFLWAAAGAAISAGAAARSWEKYEDLATAAGSAASGETRLVEGEQVTDALLAAVMDTAFAFLDGFQAVKGAARAMRAVAAREGLEGLSKLGAAEAREAIETAVRELGPDETIRRSGKTAEELAEIVGHESETGAKLRSAGEKVTVEPPSPEMAGGGGPSTAAPTEAGRRIAAQAGGMFEKWATLAPAERLGELVKIVNDELAKLGCPALKPAPEALGATVRGRFKIGLWQLQVNEALLQSGKITQEEFARLVNTVTHEARHAEQWFRMAQLEAMTTGKNAGEIATKLGIPKDIAEAAIEVQAGIRKGVPLVAGSAAEAEAKTWYKQIYEAAGAQARKKIYEEKKRTAEALRLAQEELERLKKVHPKGHPDVDAARARRNAAKAERVKAHNDYLALPEEVDARAAGEAAGAAMKERFEILDRIKAARAAERQAFAKYEPLEQLWESVVDLPSHSLSYDKLLEFHAASKEWQKSIYAVSLLEDELAKLAGKP